MKTMHICTAHHVELWQTHLPIHTWRTGWIKELYPGDEVAVYIPPDKTNSKLYYVSYVRVARYCELEHIPLFLEEVAKYRRKFHPDHLFLEYLLFKDPPK